MKYVCPLCGGNIIDELKFNKTYGLDTVIYTCEDCDTEFDSTYDLDEVEDDEN